MFQLDHVELFVPSRWEAARWYEQVLGFQVLEQQTTIDYMNSLVYDLR